MKILDLIINTTLFEMAYEHKEAKKIVTSRSPQIFKHLLKLFIFESPENTKHWRKEITNWFREINDIYLKSKTSRPTKQDLYHWMIFDSAPAYSVRYIFDEIELVPINVGDRDNEFEAYKMLRHYYPNIIFVSTESFIKTVQQNLKITGVPK